MTTLVLAALGYSFPARPLLDEFEAGQKVAGVVRRNEFTKALKVRSMTAERTGLESVLKPDLKAIGWWSEGVRKIPVEFAVELEPRLISRWLGYLNERELWMDGEADRRWEAIREKSLGSRLFVVILSSYPTRRHLGMGDEEPNPTDEITDVRFVLDGSAGRIEPQARMVYRQRADRKSVLDEVPWWQFTPYASALTFSFEPKFEAPLIDRGDYARAWWLVWSDVDLGAGPLSLKIASRRKIRSAEF